MAKNLVVKDNALINASYNLELVEQRLILLAIVEARTSGKGVTPNNSLTITASSYMNHFDTNRNTAYQALKDACNNLFERQFSYIETNTKGNTEVVRSRWVSEIRYIDNEASVKLIFSPTVSPLITLLEKNFASYELEQVAQLNSKYAVRLYEVVIAWRSTGKTPMIAIDELRNRLGVLDDEYTVTADFKRWALDNPIKQINEKTEINLSYEQHKQGRKIIGFTFTIKQKSTAQQTKQTANINLDNLTDQEHDIIAQKNAYADSIGATAEHRQNLIKQALKQHQDAIQAEQEAKQRKKAERQAQKEHEKQQLELARKQYEQILASDTLINAYIANNINPQKMRASLQKMRYEQGDFRGVFELEKHKFEKLSYLKSLNLKFLDKINSWKWGVQRGGFIPLLQAQRSSKLLFLCTVCYACLGKLRGFHDGDFGKNTILEKHKIGNRRASNFKFFGKLQKWESLLPKLWVINKRQFWVCNS